MSPRLAKKLSKCAKPSSVRVHNACKAKSFIFPTDNDDAIEFELELNENSKLQEFLKRTIDILGSLVLLVILSPIFVAVGILLKVLTEDTIIYSEQRVGKDEKLFEFYKFKTMFSCAEVQKELLKDQNEMQGPFFKVKDDPRVTEFGKFLRKYSVDELPQLYNVLKGDMSLVGPRPCQPKEYMMLKEWQKVAKTYMRPGITCIWQTNGRNLISNHNEWMKLDLEYISNWSVENDIKLLFKTIPAVISAKGAS